MIKESVFNDFKLRPSFDELSQCRFKLTQNNTYSNYLISDSQGNVN